MIQRQLIRIFGRSTSFLFFGFLNCCFFSFGSTLGLLETISLSSPGSTVADVWMDGCWRWRRGKLRMDAYVAHPSASIRQKLLTLKYVGCVEVGVVRPSPGAYADKRGRDGWMEGWRDGWMYGWRMLQGSLPSSTRVGMIVPTRDSHRLEHRQVIWLVCSFYSLNPT